MSRTTKVVGVSLPPETNNKIEDFIKKHHKTRSEFFREMIENYFSHKNTACEALSELDIANSLRNYWILRSGTDMKLIIIGLGMIINNKNEVLIGARKNKDKWVENLSWVFPGGKLTSLDFKTDIVNIIKRETNLSVEVKSLVSVRIHPDSGFKNVQVIAFYFHCEALNNLGTKKTKDLQELKWVPPLDVFKYFTTSTSDEVTQFLAAFDKSVTR
ncbi:MAG: NUDIX domain-containing protein [Paludibacteraceae bacterium]|nr:NUDIX domain-containing protein [Paludibacteraceae bacterium]